MSKNDMISVEAAARKLNKSTKTIYRMLEDGRLGGRKEKGMASTYNTWMVSKESIELYLEETRLWSTFEEEKRIALTLF